MKVSLALGLAGSALLPVIVSSPEFVVTANVLLVYVAIMAIIAPWLYWGKTLLSDGANNAWTLPC